MELRSVIVVVLSGLMAMACGANDCEEAVERIAECGGIDAKDVDVDSCDGRSECIADCVKDSTCADIASADPNNPYQLCVLSC